MRRRGYILVQVLIVVAFLSALMAMLAANQRAMVRNLSDELRQRKALEAARSGVAEAISYLEQANVNDVGVNDDWATLGSSGDDLFDMGGTSYRVQIVDAGARINLNTATQAQLQMLPLTQAQVDCLLDWRSAGQTPRPDGAKDEYYNSLDPPYNTRLGPLATVSELLLIRNWTGHTLYSTETDVSPVIPLPTDVEGNTLPLASMITVDSGSPNVSPTGGPLINLGVRNINGNTLRRLNLPAPLVDQIVARAPFTSFAALLGLPGMTTAAERSLLNGVTFSTATRSTGKVNLNTASQSVLETVPGVTPDIASSIVAQQSTGFTSLGAMTTISGVSRGVLARIADSFTVGSDTWIVRAYGQCNGVGVPVEAVVQVTSGRAHIQTWSVGGSGPTPAWWGWRPQTTQTIERQVQG